MRTGEVKAPPAVEPQATFEVRIFGEDIMVKAGSSSPQVREESKGAASVVYTSATRKTGISGHRHIDLKDK